MKLSAGSCIGRRFPGQSTDRKRGNAGGGEVRRNAGTAGSGAPRNEHFLSKCLTGRQRSAMLLCEPSSCGAVSLYKEREKDSKTPFAAFRHFSETCVSSASEKTQRKQGEESVLRDVLRSPRRSIARSRAFVSKISTRPLDCLSALREPFSVPGEPSPAPSYHLYRAQPLGAPAALAAADNPNGIRPDSDFYYSQGWKLAALPRIMKRLPCLALFM